MKKQPKTKKCPRCSGPLEQFPGDRGALSRADNTTMVCGRCGLDEAVKGGAALYDAMKVFIPTPDGE